MKKAKISVAVLTDSFWIPAWLYELLKRIIQSDYASLCLVIKNSAAGKKNIRKTKNALYFIYRKFEDKYVRLKHDAFTLNDIRSLAKDVDVLEIRGVHEKNNVHFDDEDVCRISRYNLDVCIKVGLGKLNDEVLQCFRFGCWTFNDGTNFFETNVPVGVWEVVRNLAVTESALLQWKNEAPQILYRSRAATNTNIKRNVNEVYWKSLSFILRRLEEAYEFGDVSLSHQNHYDNNALAYGIDRLSAPSNIVFISYLAKYFLERLKKKFLNRNSFEQWALLYKFEEWNNKLSDQIVNCQMLLPPKDRFWADPSAFSINPDNQYIFIEEYIYNEKKAHISALRISKSDASPAKPEVVLTRPYHLSYPFVFRVDADIFMIPESSANKTVELYGCISFPDKWEFKLNLMENLHAVDATIYHRDNTFWLFVNIKENEGASAWDELFLFYSDTLLTNNWHPHPQNPVVSDVCSARPAGNLFEKEGKLYRPSQDCSEKYGYAININHVLLLNKKEYREQKVKTIYPDWKEDIVATHTLSQCEGLFVLDVKQKRRK